MHPETVAIVYNEPAPGRYVDMGEQLAIVGVLDQVAAVDEALLMVGCRTSRVPLSPPFEEARAKLAELKVDLVFNLFEGFDGRPETEAALAEAIADLGLPSTGCPASAMALALDKIGANALFERSGIPTPRSQLLSPEAISSFCLGYPCIVKPAGEHASHGLCEKSVVRDWPTLKEQVARVSQLFGGHALVQEFLSGREFNITVLGNKTVTMLPVSEILYSLPATVPPILTFDAKWEPESLYFRGTQVQCPARIDDTLRAEIESVAREAFRIAGCRGYARVDMRMDSDGCLRVMELNPNPDISPDTGAARQARAAGMTYAELIERIVRLALDQD